MMSALSGWTHDYSATHTPSLMHRDSPPGGHDQAYSEPARGVVHILPLAPPLTGKGRFKSDTDKVNVMLGNSKGCARTVRLRTGRAANLDDV
jgi:hypothetical protein